MSGILDSPVAARPIRMTGTDRLASTTQTYVVDADRGQVLSFPDGEQEQEPRESGHFLRHDFNENLADHLLDSELSAISADLLEGIEADIASRRDWTEAGNRAVDFLGLKVAEAHTELTEMGTVSNIWHTLIMEAAIKFWANAVAEFLPAAGPAKVRDDQPEAPQGSPEAQVPTQRNELAEAFEKDFNHYLTTVDRQYYRDFSRMLFALASMGTEFRKVYHSPLLGRPVSEWVKGSNLIVSQEAASLQTAERATERIMMSRAQVKRLQRAGWWRDIALVIPTEDPSSSERKIAEVQGLRPSPERDKDARHTIYECYTDLDLPGFEHEEDGEQTGLPLPYRVTIDKDSRQVLEVRRNWRDGDSEFIRRTRYVMYGLIPGLGFYYLGFAHVAGNLERALTAMMRMMIDAGMFANFPGGIRLKGQRSGTSEIKPRPGQFVEVDPGGADDIRKVAVPLPYKDPSAVFAAFIEKLAQDGRTMLGTAEAPVGEGVQNMPVGTMLAMVEQSAKVMAAVHKGLHVSQAEEFRLMQELFAEDPQSLTAFAKTPTRQWQAAHEFADLELVPASDPNVPSQVHRIGLAVASLEMASSPVGMALYNQRRIHEDARRTVGLPTDPGIWAPQQQGQQAPDPKLVLAQMKMQSDEIERQRKAATDAANLQERAATREAKQQEVAATIASKERIAAMDHADQGDKLAADVWKHGAGIASDLHQHSVDTAADMYRHHVPAAQAPQQGAGAPAPEGFARGGLVAAVAPGDPMIREALAAMRREQEAMRETVARLLDGVATRKRVVRDDDGRIVGVEVVRDDEDLT